MITDFGPAIRTALINEVAISGLLATWKGEPAIFTRRPTPSDTGFPAILIAPDVAVTNFDAVNKLRVSILKDIIVYGDQPDDYRAVETMGSLIKDLFHRKRFSIDVSGYHVIQIVAGGPSVAPTDDDKQVARVVTLTILAQRNAP